MRLYEIDDSSNRAAFPDHWAAANLLYSMFKRGGSMSEEPRAENWGGKDSITFSVRDWGQWVVPMDAEDDGDYDWKEMTAKSGAEANRLVQQVKDKFPHVEIDWGGEEKNWLFFQIPLS